MNIFNLFRKQAKQQGKTAADLKPIGMVTHYYDKIGVAVLKLDAALGVGDTVRFTGKAESMQVVTSMQIDHKPVEHATAGDNVALKTDKPVREHDVVGLVSSKAVS